jgi:hypothetical protein
VSALEAARFGRAVQSAAADQYVRKLLPFLTTLRAGGITSIGATTKALNERGLLSLRGGRWHVSSVSNLLARARRFAWSLLIDGKFSETRGPRFTFYHSIEFVTPAARMSLVNVSEL